MAAKYRITVNLDSTEYEALQRIATDADRSLAWLGRRAICKFIEQYKCTDAPQSGGLMADETPTTQSTT